jgi:hypothetical protein
MEALYRYAPDFDGLAVDDGAREDTAACAGAAGDVVRLPFNLLQFSGAVWRLQRHAITEQHVRRLDGDRRDEGVLEDPRMGRLTGSADRGRE